MHNIQQKYLCSLRHRSNRLSTVTFLLIAFLLASFSTVAQKITLSEKNAPMRKVFDQIRTQTGYDFLFTTSILKAANPVTISVKNMPLKDVLVKIFDGQLLQYEIREKTVVVKKMESTKPQQVSDENLQLNRESTVGRNISGVVYDEKTNLPIRGVNVVVNSTRRGTQTDEKGRFSLKGVNENDKLKFSFIGYEPFFLQLSTAGDMVTIKMKITNNELDKAVVQAYGTTSKRLATGNIGKVTAEEIARQPVLNPLMALQGKVPGLLVTSTGGNSGAPVKVEIRGRNSVDPRFLSEPLYIVDGVPLTVLELQKITSIPGVGRGMVQGGDAPSGGQSPLFGINPNDIESIEVLKDGDATAIYGSRGANGVILITTKRAKPGKTAFNLRVTQGLVMVPRFQDMMNTQEYLAVRREAFANDGELPTIANAPDLLLWDSTRYTNWQRELLTNGRHTAVSASVSGGDSRTTFGISTNYAKRIELMGLSGSTQLATVATNINHRSLNQKLALSFSAGYSYSVIDAVNMRRNSFNLAPNAPAVYDKNGMLNYEGWNPAGLNKYPFTYLAQEKVSTTNSLSSSLNISYELFPGLLISANTGFGNAQNFNNSTTPIAVQNPRKKPTGSAQWGKTNNNNWIFEPQLKYSRFIAKGNLSVQVGGSLQMAKTVGGNITASGFANDGLLGTVNFATSVQAQELTSQYKYVAAFARINYNWDYKYILNINMRRDGSSRFGPGKQFGNFGSAAFAWIASEESWMKKALPTWFSFVKFRSSYAITGSDGIGDYQYLTQWKSYDNLGQPMYDFQGFRPLVSVQPVNQQYHWQTNKQLEVAMSLGFLKDKINVDIAWYRKRCDNQLTALPTPIYTGFPSVAANSKANVQNAGLELSVSAKLIDKKDFDWTVSFNIGANRNKLLAYPGIEFSPDKMRYKIGSSVTTLFLMHYIGIDPQTGNFSYEDYGKNGYGNSGGFNMPGSPGSDALVEVDPTPKYFGGASSNMSYKSFSLSLGFNFTRALGAAPFLLFVPGTMNNLYLPAAIRNKRWQKPGDIAEYPRYTTKGTNTLESSDGAFTDASYFRLNNIAISYSLPSKFIKKAGLQSCSINMNCQNIFTITGYKGLDPEVQDITNTPTPRVITSSIIFNF